ncbi:hypothetical protein JCM19992_32200 [Thermostilla marina]
MTDDVSGNGKRCETVFRAGRVHVVKAQPTGTFSHVKPRYYLEHPGAVAILPIASRDPLRVVLIENFRHTIDGRLLEIPAGTLEPGEDPTEAARRELAEETGYLAGSLKHLFTFMPSPGLLSERMHLFLATDLEPGTQRTEADEDIRVVELDWTSLWARLGEAADAGAIDGKTLLALLYARSVWFSGLPVAGFTE